MTNREAIEILKQVIEKEKFIYDMKIKDKLDEKLIDACNLSIQELEKQKPKKPCSLYEEIRKPNNCMLCGSEVVIKTDKEGKQYYATCSKCGLTSSSYYNSKENSIRAWNGEWVRDD